VPVTCPHCGHVQPEPPGAYSTVCKQCRQHYRVQDVLQPAEKPKDRPKDRLHVTCPHCGHAQDEPKGAYSTVCKQCRQHYRIEEVLRPAPKTPEPQKEVRRVACFQCGTELEVSPAAKSTMCKRCSGFVDLSDYRIDHSVTKNFKTKGRFVIEEKGFVFNTNSIVGEAVIKGKLHGKLVAERSLEIHGSADFRGSFQTPRLVIPEGTHFRWNEMLALDSADVTGELVADLRATGTVAIRSSGRLFGNIEARSLVVEDGAIVVGVMKIGEHATRDRPSPPP
jgi:cytoskeletal protein CcmA (bactofilin family)/ribosomal protein S27E